MSFYKNYHIGIGDETFEDENTEINATEVVEFDEHAKQIIDDNMVEVIWDYIYILILSLKI